MMARMQVLITNNTLSSRAGSELYVRDLAFGLRDRGHTPTAYSTKLGDVADEIRAAGVPVIDELDALEAPPDIIHGHHHLDTMTALLRFPGTPAIYVCHGSVPWEEAAPRFPRILRYVAVDQACRKRLLIDHAIPEDRIRVVLNFVDLERFKSRPPLPAYPQRALIFSNQANEYTHVGAIRRACDLAGIPLDVVGMSAGKVSAQPEALLGNYDIVFAKGRSALEALAVGAAVILCDASGAGPMVTTDNVDELRPLNFGIRALRYEVRSDLISREIGRYEPADSARVSQFIRATAGREEVLDQLVSLYQEVIDENQTLGRDMIAEQRAVAAYLRELAPRLKQYAGAMQKLAAKETQLEMMTKSRSWRLVTRYTGIRQRVLRPVRRFFGSMPQPRTSNGTELDAAVESRSARDIFTE